MVIYIFILFLTTILKVHLIITKINKNQSKNRLLIQIYDKDNFKYYFYYTILNNIITYTVIYIFVYIHI